MGLGKIMGPNQVSVEGGGDQKILQTKNIILATGSTPRSLPALSYDGVKIISSTEALNLSYVPEHLVVVGAGAIGLEMASIWSRLGSRVTVVEFSDKICGAMDRGISQKAQQILQKQGIEFILLAKVVGAEMDSSEVIVNYEDLKGGGVGSVQGSEVLVAVGRQPFSDALALDEIGIQRDSRGFVRVDEQFRLMVNTVGEGT